MFADGYFSLSFAEMLGLLVTIVSVYFVVKQLREAKLASQMDGLLTLSNQFIDLYVERSKLIALTSTEKWEKMSKEEAYSTIFDDAELLDSYVKIGNTFDLLATLVSSRALEFKMSAKLFAHMAPYLFRRLEIVIQQDRVNDSEPAIFQNWEWLVIEYEKLSD
jgi:hypothetical protein